MPVLINDFELTDNEEEEKITGEQGEEQEEPKPVDNEELLRRQVENLLRTWAH